MLSNRELKLQHHTTPSKASLRTACFWFRASAASVPALLNSCTECHQDPILDNRVSAAGTQSDVCLQLQLMCTSIIKATPSDNSVQSWCSQAVVCDTSHNIRTAQHIMTYSHTPGARSTHVRWMSAVHNNTKRAHTKGGAMAAAG
jgi:hypothetical protein